MLLRLSFRQLKLEKYFNVLVSFDVTDLFTKVPVPKSLDAILNILTQDNTLTSRTPLTPTRVRDLLTFCLTTTYFQFDNQIYTQVEGAAMGSPVSPIVANLYMEWFEDHTIASFQSEFALWKRYVDDTIIAISVSLIEALKAHRNAIDQAIQLTTEENWWKNPHA